MTPSLTLVPTTVVAATQHAGRQRGQNQRVPLRVREWPLRYEQEGSERLVRGAVSVAPDAWWSVALSVPESVHGSDHDAVFVRMARHGPVPPGYPGGLAMELSLPRSEIDAIVVLLSGVVEQARRDAVLSARAS